MGPLAEIQRPSSFHPTAVFLDGHHRPRLYRTCILSQSISLFKYPSELSTKPHRGEASGHFDPQIVRTNPNSSPDATSGTLVAEVVDVHDHFVPALVTLHGERPHTVLAQVGEAHRPHHAARLPVM